MGLLDFFKKEKQNGPVLKVDMHSHLLPGLDDGADDLEQSVALIRHFSSLGYTRLITTPHIMGDFYKNTPETIHAALDKVRNAVAKENIPVEIDAAAEYYMDEWFTEKLRKPESILTFGKNYLLVETSYMNRPGNLEDLVFQIKSSGLQPVLAHPERYTYMYHDFSDYEDLYDRGFLFQINTISLTGYYSKAAKNIAEKLLKKNMVSFLGSDCHAERHLKVLEKAFAAKSFKKIDPSNILNNTL